MLGPRRCASALAEAAHQPLLNTRTSHQQKTLPSKELHPPWLHCPLQFQDTHRQPSTENGSQNHIQDLCKHGHLDPALEILSHMHIPPSPATYTSLLKACSRNKALPQTECILQHLARSNTQLPSLICDYLVVTLAKCGNVDIACHIFVTLPHRTTFSWTAIISAHVDCGHAREAIEMHQYMQIDGIELDSFTFASLFKACGSVSDLEYGKKLHGEAYKKGYDSDVFVNNTLVSMYGKCRAILESENVFVRLTRHDIISWNAMLSIYLEQDQGRRALLLYRQMQEESVSPDKHTFVFALQACEICLLNQEVHAQQGQELGVICLEIGQALHADAQKKGFASDVFVGTALIHMYGRCAAILEMEGVFCALSECDIVAWNALLSIYSDQRQGSKSLQLYVYMQGQKVIPGGLTFMFAFQACGIVAETEEPLLVEGCTVKVSSLEIGKALHVDADRQGYTSGGFVGNTLLSMYVKCGGIAEAEDAFCKFSQRDTVSWNVMLSAYIEQGLGEKSLKLYRQFKNEGECLDVCVLISAVQACCALSELRETKGCSLKKVSLEIGQALHADTRKEVFASDTFLNTTLVSMYSKCGAVEKAEYVIGSMLQLDTVSWNAMLSAYVEHGQGEKVLQAYKQMLEEGVRPDHLTFVCALQACGILAEKGSNAQNPTKLLCLEIGQALHTDASKLGCASDVLVGTAILSMYGKCGSVVNAKDAFWALSYRDTVSWNAMLSVLVEHSQVENALCLYRDMHKQGVIVNDVTFICVLHACSEAGSLDLCKQLHFCIVAAGYGRMGAVSATLVHAYGNCASTEDAQMSFDTLSKSDFVSWSACLAGYATEGNILACFYILENLKLEGLKPDEVMFASVLSACSRAGLVTECLELFVCMREYGLIPSLKHHGIMIELFGHAGDFERLKNFLGSMPVQADLTLWLCLLGACHTHGNLDLAKQAFDHASKMQSMQAAPYIMMANIFAEAGMLEIATTYKHNKGE